MPVTDFGEGNGTPLQHSCLENPMDWGAWSAAVHGVAKSRARLSDFTFTFHFHALEEVTHSSILAWRIPGTEEPGGLPSMGSHRVGHDWSDLAAAAAAADLLLPSPKEAIGVFAYVFPNLLINFICVRRLLQKEERKRGNSWGGGKWILYIFGARQFCVIIITVSDSNNPSMSLCFLFANSKS